MGLPVVFLGKALYSLSTILRTGEQIGGYKISEKIDKVLGKSLTD